MKKALVAALLIIISIPMLIAVAAMPPHGDADSPVHTHVSARYIEHGEEEAGAENLVTGVLLNYRGLDTAGEVIVIFTALMAAFAVLITHPGRGEESGPTTAALDPEPGTEPESDSKAPPPISPVVSFMVRLLTPFTTLFAIYVILNGHVTPGGGFQGGAILGGMFIALTIVLGEDKVRTLLPRRAAPWMQGAAVFAFVAIGVIGAATTGYFLGYPTDASLHLVRELMMVVIEIGIGLGGAAIFATIFLQMEAE